MTKAVTGTDPDIPAEAIGMDTKGSLNVAIRICNAYPHTAGRYLAAAHAMRKYQSNPDVTAIPKYTNRAAEKGWGSHVLGQLKTCESGHLYSGGSFAEGCPECGKQVELPEVEYTKSAQFLFEDRFLAQMKGESR